MNESTLYVTDPDRCRLGVYLATPSGRAWGDRRWLGDLEDLLEQAQPVEPSLAPNSLVTMNSTVKLLDEVTGDSSTVTLAYPDEIDLVPGGISIFDPLGVALLGREEGDLVECPDDSGERRLRVAEIVYQPEQAGSLHL